MAEAAATGNQHFSHFGPEANVPDAREALFRNCSEIGTGRFRKYLHDTREATPLAGSRVRTAIRRHPPGTDATP